MFIFFQNSFVVITLNVRTLWIFRFVVVVVVGFRKPIWQLQEPV